MNNGFKLTRLQQILGGLLALQLALAVWVFWPQDTASAGGPLLPEFSAEEITTVTISSGEGEQLTLSRADEGWLLPEADDFLANGESIDELLEKLAAVQTGRLVAQTESSYGRLQVAENDFNRKINLTGADGGSQTVYVGSSAGAGATHVRREGASEVYLTGELNSWDVDAAPAGWIETLYFSVPTTATTHLTLENGNGVFEFEQTADGGWQMNDLAEDETFNEGEFTSLLNTVQSVQMTAPLGRTPEATYGLEPPQATVTLETGDETHTLQLGAQSETDNSYVLKASTSPYYVRVSAFVGDALTDKTRDSFMQPPPEAESPAGGSTESIGLPATTE